MVVAAVVALLAVRDETARPALRYAEDEEGEAAAAAPMDEDEEDAGPMENAVVLHEDKKYYPR